MTKVTWVSSITGDNRLAFNPKAWTFLRFSFISQQRDASSVTTNSNSIKGEGVLLISQIEYMQINYCHIHITNW